MFLAPYLRNNRHQPRETGKITAATDLEGSQLAGLHKRMNLGRFHIELIRCLRRRQEAVLFWFFGHRTSLSTTTFRTSETAHQCESQFRQTLHGAGAAWTAHDPIDVENRIQKRPLLTWPEPSLGRRESRVLTWPLLRSTERCPQKRSFAIKGRS